MCYFMYVSSHKEIDEHHIKQIWDEAEIVVDKLQHMAGAVPGVHYYSIHRQCACDFVDCYHPRSNVDQLKALFTSIGAPFQFIITDTQAAEEQSLHDPALMLISRNHPNELRSLPLHEFLDNYPQDLEHHIVHHVDAQ